MSIFDKTEQEEFNMEDYGFTIIPDGKCGSRLCGKSYYLATDKSSNGDTSDLKLCLSSEDAKVVRDMFGEYVKIGMNDKGFVCIYEGKGAGVRKMYPNGGHTKSNKAGHWTISMAAFAKKARGIFGDFRRVYVDVSFYANQNAILCRPNGDMD